jgi:hypothetical protein
MHEGHSAGIIDTAEATQEKIMALATGVANNGKLNDIAASSQSKG